MQIYSLCILIQIPQKQELGMIENIMVNNKNVPAIPFRTLKIFHEIYYIILYPILCKSCPFSLLSLHAGLSFRHYVLHTLFFLHIPRQQVVITAQ